MEPKTERRTKMEKYTCPVCNKEFSWYTAIVVSHLRKHVGEGRLNESRNEHGGVVFTTPEGTIVKHARPSQKKEESSKGTPIFVCRLCNRTFDWYTANVILHLRKHVSEGRLAETSGEDGNTMFVTPDGEIIPHTPTTCEGTEDLRQAV